MDYAFARERRISSDESQLILKAQKGDRWAFNDLVLIHQDAIYNLAYRILGDSKSAEDITQSAFLIAYRSMPRFRNGSFRSWLFRIATNSCYDEIRRRKRHPLLSIESADGIEERLFPPYALPKPEISPEQMCEQHELEQAVQHALNLLSPDRRVVVVLVDLQGMDYQGAAQILQIPIGTLRSRLSRARTELRQILIHQDNYGVQ